MKPTNEFLADLGKQKTRGTSMQNEDTEMTPKYTRPETKIDWESVIDNYRMIFDFLSN